MVFAETVESGWRSTLGTGRVEGFGDVDVVVPDFTRAMASDLDFLELPAEELRDSDFFPFLQRGTVAWNDFFSTRKVVCRETEDGRMLASVTSNVADVLKAAPVSAVAGRDRPKMFEVVQLLTDPSLVEKFGIRGTFRADMRNLASVDTMRAAMRLQEHIRVYEGYEKAVVSAGKYAGSWKAARETIKNQAARFPPLSVVTEALFVGDKIFIYSESEVDNWRVFGPSRVASLVQLVHRMVTATSCEAVIFSLGTELTILDIDVHNGEEVLSPVRERHAGPHDDLPLGMSTQVRASFSAEQRARLETLCVACETVAIDGVDSATAVRITSGQLLLNAHVVNEGGELTSNGVPISGHRMLSRDLWLAKSPGPEVAWHLRDPVVGEQVVLCYRRHSELVWGGPVTVSVASPEILVLEKDACMQPGVSGAAVVALSDMALLGLYDGLTIRRALVAAFTSAMYTDLCTASEMGDGCRAAAREEGATIFSQMKERGLGKVVETAMSAVVPLYSGDVHVGMGFGAGNRLFTVCDPDVAPMAISQGQPLVFSRGPGRMFEAIVVEPLPPGPAVVRGPAYGEKVFVVGRDIEGSYCSLTTGKVVHVGVGAETFQLAGLNLRDALPLQGGLVLAHADGAVVGVFSNPHFDMRRGELVNCYAFPKVETVVVEERAEVQLMKIFPFLRCGAWADGVALSAIQHASAVGGSVNAGQMALAMIGDSAMRTVLWTRLRDLGVPAARWQMVIARDQSNAAQAAMCEKLGLHKLLRTAGGLVVAPGSKLYADLLEAVAGAVYLSESSDAFVMFCSVIGVVKDNYDDIMAA